MGNKDNVYDDGTMGNNVDNVDGNGATGYNNDNGNGVMDNDVKPRDETRRAFQPRLMGGWGQLPRRTIPRQLGMHWSQGTPLHPQAACWPQLLTLQRAPRLARGGRLQANPPLLCLQQHPGMLMHDRAASWPWPLVWEWATRLAQ